MGNEKQSTTQISKDTRRYLDRYTQEQTFARDEFEESAEKDLAFALEWKSADAMREAKVNEHRANLQDAMRAVDEGEMTWEELFGHVVRMRDRLFDDRMRWSGPSSMGDWHRAAAVEAHEAKREVIRLLNGVLDALAEEMEIEVPEVALDLNYF